MNVAIAAVPLTYGRSVSTGELSPASSRKRAFEEKKKIVLAIAFMPSYGKVEERRVPNFVLEQEEAVRHLLTEAEIVEEEARRLEEEIRRMEEDLDECDNADDTDEETECEDELDEEDEEDEEEDEGEDDWRREYEEEEKDEREGSRCPVPMAVQPIRYSRNRFIKEVLMSRRPQRVRIDPARF